MVFVDESGFSLIPYVAKIWAPVGRTPVFVHQGRWPKFLAISGVTPRGRLFFRVYKDSINGVRAVAFLRHLLRHIRRRPILVFWDNGQAHRSKLVQAFLHAHPRLKAHRFPRYSPELNPDEWVGSYLKKHELASAAPHDLPELRSGLRRAVMRMRVRPALTRSFYRATPLAD